MRVPRHDSSRSFGGYMTPMIDVVFLLIIFFLVSSHLARREQDLPLELPAAETGEVAPLDIPRLTLHVFSDGRLSLGGTTLNSDELLPRLAAAQARAEATLELRIRADRSVAYRHIAPVLAAAYDAGLGRVTFSVRPLKRSALPGSARQTLLP